MENGNRKGENEMGNVEIVQDGDVTHFILMDEEPKKTQGGESWFKRMLNWFRNGNVTPYVKIRDAGDPFRDRTDPDECGGG